MMLLLGRGGAGLKHAVVRILILLALVFGLEGNAGLADGLLKKNPPSRTQKSNIKVWLILQGARVSKPFIGVNPFPFLLRK